MSDTPTGSPRHPPTDAAPPRLADEAPPAAGVEGPDRLAALQQSVERLVTETRKTRRRLGGRLFAIGLLGTLIALSALNPSRGEHQEAVFDEASTRIFGEDPTARAMMKLAARGERHRLLPIDRINLGLLSVGMAGDAALTIGVLGQVYVIDD